MAKMIDLTGQRFGFWIVVKPEKNNKNGKTQWQCKCECGRSKIVTTNSLRTGNSTSCGCNHNPDLLNREFGKLLVTQLNDTKTNGRRHWLCKCNCGESIITSTYQLTSGNLTSCGCDVKDDGYLSAIMEMDEIKFLNPAPKIIRTAIGSTCNERLLVLQEKMKTLQEKIKQINSKVQARNILSKKTKIN